MKSTKGLTDEQIIQLECDAHAFLKASKFAADYIKRTEAAPMSTGRVSMTTVSLTNLGMAFELKLKALCAKTIGAFPHTHLLAELFRHLPPHIQSELEKIYAAGPTYELTAYIRAKEQPIAPPAPVIAGFQGFLSYLDEIGLYGRRFSFEIYSSNEWRIEINADSMIDLLNRITEFSNGLGETGV